METGLEQDTLVFFVSDNGGPFRSDTSMNGARNEPLRAGKRTTLEGGIRVPFVVAWPGQVKPGIYALPVIQLDLTATALAVAGVATDPEVKLDGVNLLPFLKGEKSGEPHDALYWRFGKQMAIRAGDYKLVRYDTNADTRTGKFNQPISPARLFNVTSDIEETGDLAKAMPDKAKELQAKWDAWNALNIRPRWPSAHEKDDGFEPAPLPPPQKAGNKPGDIIGK